MRKNLQYLATKPTVKIQLYSGNINDYLIKKLWNPDLCFYVNLGTSQSIAEINHLKKTGLAPSQVRVIRGIDLHRYERTDAVIPYKNAYLALAAMNEFERLVPAEWCKNTRQEVQIYLNDSYAFSDYMSSLLSLFNLQKEWTGGCKREVKVVPLYKDHSLRSLLHAYVHDKSKETKQMLLETAWNDSFSCCIPSSIEQSLCDKCLIKIIAFTLEGYVSPNEVMKAKRYIKDNHIIEKIRPKDYEWNIQENYDIINFQNCT